MNIQHVLFPQRYFKTQSACGKWLKLCLTMCKVSEGEEFTVCMYSTVVHAAAPPHKASLILALHSAALLSCSCESGKEGDR